VEVPTERPTTVSFVARSFSTFLVETSLGPQVRIQAEDGNDNEDTTAQRGPNAFAKAASVIDDLGGNQLLPAELAKLRVIGLLAALSGFTYYIASTVDQVVSAVKLAVDIIRGKVDTDISRFFDTIGLLINRPEVLLSVPGAIINSARRAQALQNPFPPSEFPDTGDPFEFDVDNITFAGGWYLGGVLGIAAEAFVSAGVGSYARAIGSGIPVIRQVIRAGDAASAIIARGAGVVKRGALTVGRGIAQGGRLALNAVTEALSRVSVAKQVVVNDLTDRLDTRVLDVASGAGRTRELVDTLAIGDDAARSLLEDADDDTIRRLFRVANCRASPGVGGVVASAGGVGGRASNPVPGVALSVGRVGATQVDICPDDLQRIDPNDLAVATIIKRISDLKGQGRITSNEIDEISRLLTDSDVDNDRIAETLTAGDDEVTRFLVELGDGSPEGSVEKFTELAENPAVAKRAQRFAQFADSGGALVFKRLDQSELNAFFRIDFDRATVVRTKLAEFATGSFGRFSTDDIKQFATDIQTIRTERPDLDADIDRGYISQIASLSINEGSLSNIIGDLQELSIARRLIELDRDSVDGLEVDGGKVTYTDINDGEVTRDVEIDVQTQNALVESKAGSVDSDIINQIRKYRRYRDEVLGDSDRDIVVVVEDSDEISDSLEQRIRDEGAEILEPSEVSQLLD